MNEVKRPLPLAGVKVLDISQGMAGPYACTLLGDLGADVIKADPRFATIAQRPLSYPEAFGSEHAQVRGMRMEIDHPVEGKVPNIGFAVKLSGTPQQVRRHPPLLGEHTEEVLEEIGIRGDALARLRAQGAFGS